MSWDTTNIQNHAALNSATNSFSSPMHHYTSNNQMILQSPPFNHHLSSSSSPGHHQHSPPIVLAPHHHSHHPHYPSGILPAAPIPVTNTTCPPFNLKPTNNSPGAVPLTPVTCAPHTPQGAPVNPFGPNGEHDLPPDLLALGWRKFWSKRENRWYFWNCSTGESLWEVPLPGRIPQPVTTTATTAATPGQHQPPQAGGHQLYDPLTDPLGIQCGNPPPATSNVGVGVKRRASSGENLGNLPVKKFILAGPWDLEISSNVYVTDPSIPLKHLLPPHPEIEKTRAQLVAKLRQCYQTACHSREAIDSPKESLNRWFIEQKVTELRGLDPIFPSCENPDGVVSNNMLKEIMNDIPMKVTRNVRFTGDARKQLSKFAESCKRMVETRSTSSEARKVVKWKVEETFTWLRASAGVSYERLLERLDHLRVTCQPHVHAAARLSVEGICKKMSLLSKQYAQTIRETHLKLFTDPENVKVEAEGEKGKIRCYPALCGPYIFTEAGRLPTVDFVQPEREFAVLKFRNDAVRISTQYLQKLEQLYRYNCLDDRKFEFFLVRCYCLLKRYNAYCDDFNSCQSTQESLPVPVFEAIQRNFGVTFECFSSPFNCYFRQYCSAFPDIDGYFGSRGTFLDFHPISGSFEMNPPFQEELINAAISHAEELLGSTREPMSFIVFLPEFTEEKDDWGVFDLKCDWIKRLESSRWKRKQVTIAPYEHEGRCATQHSVLKCDQIVRISHATVVFWLQNEAGFEEWKPTDQRVDTLIDAYRPGRERERDRQDFLSEMRKKS